MNNATNRTSPWWGTIPGLPPGQAGFLLLCPLVVWVRFPLVRFHLGRGRLTAAAPASPPATNYAHKGGGLL